MMPRIFSDDISNRSGVIVLTDIQRDKQTDRQMKSQTDITENNTTLAARVETRRSVNIRILLNNLHLLK